ncbi:Transcription factor bHLH47 [Apostasia shenzhenica]|uniref:Transcription factor bHLH47 n=1 Tax=Apostasia shenzhenica TaxID=1088818 RepID=A0A2I0A5A3_9ASPA|nr:Transcription factor bHLH47 [Apostasia shenzhenica]
MDTGSKLADKPVNESIPKRKNYCKVPKKIHKAEREKLKRDQLNDLFFQLGYALDSARQNNGKASVLSDAARLLRDLIAHVGSLRKENSALLSESQYVTVEKNELQDENGGLQAEIQRLKSELLRERIDGDPASSSSPSLPPPVFVLPLQQLEELPSPPVAKPPSSSHVVSRPHARYPTPCDSWPQEFLLSRNQKRPPRTAWREGEDQSLA